MVVIPACRVTSATRRGENPSVSEERFWTSQNDRIKDLNNLLICSKCLYLSMNLGVSKPAHGNCLCRAIGSTDPASLAGCNNNLSPFAFIFFGHLDGAVRTEIYAERATDTYLLITGRYDWFCFYTSL